MKFFCASLEMSNEESLISISCALRKKKFPSEFSHEGGEDDGVWPMFPPKMFGMIRKLSGRKTLCLLVAV